MFGIDYLPESILYYINEYEPNFIVSLCILKKYKFENEILIQNELIEKVQYLKKLIEQFDCEYLNSLYFDDNVGELYLNYKSRLKKQLRIPEKIIMESCKNKSKVKIMKLLINKYDDIIMKRCKHTQLRSESDYDYHRPRYEYFCCLCNKQIFRNMM